jgi:hypothetical protein
MVTSSLKPTFAYVPIEGKNSMDEGLKLCLEVGEEHVSYLIANTSGTKIMHFEYYSVPKEEKLERLSMLLKEHPGLSHSFEDVILVNNTNRTVLVPDKFHKDHLNDSLFQMIHGDLEDMALHKDAVYEWEINILHGFEAELDTLLKERFPQARSVHFATTALRSAFKNRHWEEKQHVKLFFFSSSFFIMLFHGDRLQIAQHFQFQTTEDIIYHVLNVADKFQVDVNSALFETSGLLDESSPIWYELQRHFLEISFLSPDVTFDENMEISSHYFTPFFLIPACV